MSVLIQYCPQCGGGVDVEDIDYPFGFGGWYCLSCYKHKCQEQTFLIKIVKRAREIFDTKEKTLVSTDYSS